MMEFESHVQVYPITFCTLSMHVLSQRLGCKSSPINHVSSPHTTIQQVKKTPEGYPR